MVTTNKHKIAKVNSLNLHRNKYYNQSKVINQQRDVMLFVNIRDI